MCSGNHFRIVVRHPRDVTVVGGAVKAVRERGFVNYFGLQRFGKRGIRSDRVGLACLRCAAARPRARGNGCEPGSGVVCKLEVYGRTLLRSPR